ncbi:MAG: maleylacetate reductase [Thermoleophilaceae bacterium]|nr:maleylacetate reductase [Thermoleophilaceae bacterium]
MADFTFLDGERLIRFGGSALANAPRLLAERGFEDYVLLTTERHGDRVPELRDRAAVVLHVPSGGVPEGAAAVRGDVGGRPLVALGGGRVIDAAKAIAGADDLPCAAIPTTLSGAPLTRIHRMPAGVEDWNLVRPSLVIADPQLMASQPMPGLAGSAMNALAHTTESLYVPLANPVAEGAALRAAELFGSGLGEEEPRRDDLALAALLGSWAVGTTGYAFHHVVCQTIVRVGGTPHAETNAVMIPHTVRFAQPRAPERIGRLEAALGRPVADLAARSGATRLGDLGFGPDGVDDVLDAASGRAELGNTPGGTPTRDELRAYIEAAL